MSRDDHTAPLFFDGIEDALREVVRAAINYIARECGYADPAPIEPEDEIARLQREFVEATKQLGALAVQIEKMNPALRRAA